MREGIKVKLLSLSAICLVLNATLSSELLYDIVKEPATRLQYKRNLYLYYLLCPQQKEIEICYLQYNRPKNIKEHLWTLKRRIGDEQPLHYPVI